MVGFNRATLVKMFLGGIVVFLACCGKVPEVESISHGERILEMLDHLQDGEAEYLGNVFFDVIKDSNGGYRVSVKGDVRNKSELNVVIAVVGGSALEEERYYWDLSYPDGVIQGWSREINPFAWMDIEWSKEIDTGWVN